MDFDVYFTGSFYVLDANTAKARKWLAHHVPDAHGSQAFVDHHYIEDLCEHALRSRLTIRKDGMKMHRCQSGALVLRPLAA